MFQIDFDKFWTQSEAQHEAFLALPNPNLPNPKFYFLQTPTKNVQLVFLKSNSFVPPNTFWFLMVLCFVICSSPSRSPIMDNDIVMMNMMYKERFPKVGQSKKVLNKIFLAI